MISYQREADESVSFCVAEVVKLERFSLKLQ